MAISEERMWEQAVHTWDVESSELARLPKTVDRSAFIACVRALSGCRGRIVAAGVGTSSVAARKIAHSLSCIERPAFFLSPGDAVHGALGAVQGEDVAVLVSKGGGTREIVNMIPALKAKGVKIVAVTERSDSPLAAAADIVVRVQVEYEADPFNMLATSSTAAVVAVFDAVCVALMEHTGFTREQFAVIHPGGAVGARLLGREGLKIPGEICDRTTNRSEKRESSGI